MVVCMLEKHFAKWAWDRITDNTDLVKKKISFSDKAHFDLGGKTSKIVAFGTQKTRTHKLKSRGTQNESLFGADFGPVALLSRFSLKMSKERPLQ